MSSSGVIRGSAGARTRPVASLLMPSMPRPKMKLEFITVSGSPAWLPPEER